MYSKWLLCSVFICYLGIEAKPVNRILNVDLETKKNTIRHNTNSYELLDTMLIIRRADYFSFKIKFAEPFQVSEDQLRLNFTYDSTVGHKYDSIFVPVITNNISKEDSWSAEVVEIRNTELTVKANIPSNAAIGYWKLQISYKPRGEKEIVTNSESLFILLNPWSKTDSVYMNDESQRHEYVLNPIGQVYLGSSRSSQPKIWRFGQFSAYILPTVTVLLENYGLNYQQMADPVAISRALSSVINANDGNGIIVGRWQEPYAPYTEPGKWSGSAEIFKQFLDAKFKPVKYGQCWVFASTTTSACRSIGLPSRPVSCFGSRHDTDESLTIDTYFDENGETIDDMSRDMQWNFHVWTEAWMARSDMPEGFGGWQAIDATPQEDSDGLSQAGPASVNAIRHGEIGFDYDAPFVFGEVDADIVHWHRNAIADLGWEKNVMDDDPTSLFTKKLGHFNNSDLNFDYSQDVTETYKYPKNSAESKMAHLTAQKNRGLKFIFDDNYVDKNVELELNISRTMIGDPLKIEMKIFNKENRSISVSSLLNVKSIYYRGIIANAITKDRSTFTIEANKVGFHEITVEFNNYFDKLVEFELIKVYGIVMVDNSKVWSEEKTSVIEKPKIDLKVTKGHIRVGETIDLSISFTNPLNQPLTHCNITIEITGERIEESIHENVGPKALFTLTKSIKLKASGYEAIVVTFDSEELSNVDGFIVLAVSNN